MRIPRSTRETLWMIAVLAIAAFFAYQAGRGCVAATVPDLDFTLR